MRLDAMIGKLAEAGIDAVNRAAFGDDFLDYSPGRIEPLTSRGREFYLLSTCGKLGKLF